MFGKRRLLDEGAKASGVVLEADYRSVGNIGLGGISDESHEANKYRVKVRVTFNDGSTAERSVDAKRNEIGRLYKGTRSQSDMTRPTVPSSRSTYQRWSPARDARQESLLVGSTFSGAGTGCTHAPSASDGDRSSAHPSAAPTRINRHEPQRRPLPNTPFSPRRSNSASPVRTQRQR